MAMERQTLRARATVTFPGFCHPAIAFTYQAPTNHLLSLVVHSL